MMIKEEEKIKLENIKLKEWEEKFDREQKMKEQLEVLKEQRLKQRELNELNLTNDENNINTELSTKLEHFDVDKTSEH